MKRATVPWWVAAAILGAGIIWGRCERAAGAADARLSDSTAVQVARNDSLRSVNDSLAELRRADSVVIAKLATERDSLETAAGERETRGTTTAAVLRPSLPDTLRPIFDSVVTDFQASIADLERSLARADSIIGVHERANARLRAQNVVLTTAVTRTEELMGQWRSRAQPGLFTQLRRGLPFVAAGVLVGFVLGQ